MASTAPRCVPFVLLGVGGVGGELVRAIVRSRQLHADKYGLRLAALALLDSTGALTAVGQKQNSPDSPDSSLAELSDEALLAAVRHKESGGKLCAPPLGLAADPRPTELAPSAFIRRVVLEAGASAGAIVVDCTASEASLPALLAAASSPPMRAVMANKKPVTASNDAFDRFAQASARVRFEATVGAGLPAITSLQRLVASADPVSRVAGSLSGTLGYVMSALQQGQTFSEVVAHAKKLGFTEPDPRDDLGGVDVARKALIMARVLGLRLEMSDVSIEPLYDEASMGSLSVEEFMAALPSLDAGFKARVDAAAADGKVLRYAANVDMQAGKLAVGLTAVEASSPLGTLSGTDNLIEVYSAVYPTSPLVIRGAGAGVESTAAGVLADMIELAFTRDES